MRGNGWVEDEWEAAEARGERWRKDCVIWIGSWARERMGGWVGWLSSVG